MTTFLFWNVNKKPNAECIASICKKHDVDIIILAENSLDGPKLLLQINNLQDRTYISPFNTSPRLSFFLRYPESSLKLITDDGGVAIRHVIPPVGRDVILVAVHLHSKMYMSSEEQIFEATRVSNAIEEAEVRIGHENSLVIGDLNMNPFEAGVVGADGLHGVMDRHIALSLSRKVLGKDKKFFYNPMWSRMGDASLGPPGTYFYRGGMISYFWNTFDQVLIRPALLKYFSDDQLEIVTEIEDISLISGNKIDTSFSDHLPIILTLHLERGD